jgi:hypothetical protein
MCRSAHILSLRDKQNVGGNFISTNIMSLTGHKFIDFVVENDHVIPARVFTYYL